MTDISTEAIDEAVAACVYASDERKAPDDHRRSKFLSGWERAAQGIKAPDADALQRLTWLNLGYRLGQRFGAQSTAQIGQVYEYLAASWHQSQAN